MPVGRKEKTRIEGHDYITYLLPVGKALEIGAKVGIVLSSGAGHLIAVFDGEALKGKIRSNVETGNEPLAQAPDFVMGQLKAVETGRAVHIGEAVKGVLTTLLIQGGIDLIAEILSHTKRDGEQLDRKAIDENFTAENLGELLEATWWVVETNFAPFLSRLLPSQPETAKTGSTE